MISRKKLFTNTSILALLAGANSACFGAGVERVAQTDPNALSSTTNWSPAGPVENRDHITLTGRQAVSVDSPGMYITFIKGPSQLRRLDVFSPGLVLGNVNATYSPLWGVLNIYDGNDITLVGGDNASRTTNSRYIFQKTDFKEPGAVITINTNAVVDHPVDGLSAGQGDTISMGHAITNPANGTINIMTNFTMTHPDWAKIGSINVGTADAAARLFFDSRTFSTLDVSGGFDFLHEDSNFYVDFAREINIGVVLSGASDVMGELLLRTRNTGVATLNDAGGGSIGASSTQRFKSIRMWGDYGFIINVPVYVKTFDMNTEDFTNAYDIACNAVVDCGEDSLLSFSRENQSFHFNDDVSITTIDFNGNNASVYFADGKNATANIVGNANDANAVAGNLYINGANFVGTMSNVLDVYAGSAGATGTIGSGDQKVTEVQILDASGVLEFADGANLRITDAGSGGDINSTGGAAGAILFSGSSTIDGTIGANVPPSAITTNGDVNSTVVFNGAVAATTLTIGAGTVELGSGFTGNIEAANAGAGTLSLTVDGTTITGTIGATTALGVIDLQQNTTFNDAVTVDALILNGGVPTFNSTFAGDIVATANTGTLALGNVNGNLVVNGGDITVDDASANVTINGGALTVDNIAGDLSVNGGNLTLNGIVSGGLAVGGDVAFNTAANIAGNVTINSTNANASTVGDVAGDVTVTAGSLVMNDATNVAATVTINGGALTVENIAGDLSVNGGNLTLNGTVGGGLAVGGDVAFNTAANIAGNVTINSTNANASTVGDVAGDVIVTAGSLVMNDATSVAATVSIATGTLSIHSIAGDLAFTDDGVANISGNIDGVVDTSSAGAGTLSFTGDSVITGAVGANAAIGTINAGAADSVVTFSSAVTANTLNIDAGTVELGSGFTGNIEAVNAGAGTLSFTGDGSVSGTVGANDAIGTINAGAADSVVTLSSAVTANTLNIDAGTVELGSGFTGNIEAANAGAGTLSFTGDGTVSGTVGANDAIGTINAGAADSVVTFSSAVTANTLNVDAGTVELGSGFTGNIEAVNAGAGTLRFTGDSVITGAVGANDAIGTINAGAADSVVTFSSAVTANTLNIDAGTVELGSGFTGNIEAANAGAGTLSFTGDGTVSGTVGANAAIGAINAGAADSVVTFSSAVTANTLNVDAGVVEIASGFTGAIEAKNDGVGSVSLIGDGTIVGTVGALSKPALIDLQAATTFNSTVAATALSLNGGVVVFNDEVAGNVTSTVNGGSLTATTIDGNLDLSNGGTLVSATSVSGDLSVGNNGSVATIDTIGGNAVLSGTATAVATGAVGGDLQVTDSAVFVGDADSTDIAGVVTIDTDNANANIIHDADDDVTVTAGTLVMNDATSYAARVTINGGSLTINNIAHDLVFNGGNLILNGNVVGSFTIGGDAVFNSAKNIAGSVIVKSSNVNASTLGDVAGAVTLKSGALVMNNASANVNASGGAGVFNSIGGSLTLTNAANVSVDKDVSGAINTSAASELIFTNLGTVSGVVNALGSLTIKADRTFTQNVSAANLVIEGANTRLILDGADLSDSNVSSSDANSNHRIIVRGEQNITGNIGSEANPISALVMDADVTTNINTSNFYSRILTNTDGEGTVNIGASVAGISGLGAADKKLKRLDFNADNTINADIYASSINIADGQTVDFRQSVVTSNFSLAGVTSQATFNQGAVIDFSVTSTGGGIAIFSGGASVAADLGNQNHSLAQVDFRNNDASVVKLSADIFADDIILTKGALRLERASKINGNGTINSATLNLVDKALTISGNLTLNGDNSLKIKIADSKDGSGLLGGNITIDGDLILANGATIKIEPEDLRSSKDVRTARSFSLVSVTGSVTGVSGNISVTSEGVWSVETSDNGITLSEVVNVTPEPVVEKKVISTVTLNSLKKSVKTAKTASNFEKLVQNEQVAELLVNVLGGSEEKINETIERVTEHSVASANAATTSIGAMISNVGNSISNRVVDISSTASIVPSVVNASPAVSSGASATPAAPAATSSAPAAAGAIPASTNAAPASIKTNSPTDSKNNNVSGVSSGDEDAKFGVWINPFYGWANKGCRQGQSGSSNESYGGSIGFDTKLGNDSVLGIAVTFAHSNIKHKFPKSGDRTRINSKLFSIYNSQHLNDRWFALGTATIAFNEIQNHARRVASTSEYETANSKYKSSSFSLQEMLGCSYIMKDLAVITPMFGLKFNQINGTSYQETGTTFQNLTISTKSYSYLESIVGVKVNSASYSLASGVIISPEFHGFMNYNLSNQGQTPTVIMKGSKLDTSSSKSVRANYNLGAGLSVVYGAMEYGINYDMNLAHKFVGHQGSIKMRLSF